MRVDRAALSDVAALVECFAAFRREVPAVADAPFCPRASAEMVAGLIGSPRGFVGVVRDPAADEVAAVLIGAVGPYPFAPVLAADELFFYVRPAWRGGPAALRLVRAYVDFARAHGAALAGLTSTGKSCAPLYARCGFAPVETKFARVF